MSIATLNNRAITDTLRLPNYVIRPSRSTDIPGIVAVLNAHSRDVLGTSTVLFEHYCNLWPKQYFNATENTVVVTTSQNEVVGYLDIEYEHPGVLIEVGGAVHPAYRHQGIGQMLLRWAERTAHIRSLVAPPRSKVSLQLILFDEDITGRALATTADFAKIRRWNHFEIGLLKQPNAPSWPDGIKVRELDPYTDWPQVGPAIVEAYQDHWGHISEQYPRPAHSAEDELAEARTFFDNDPYFNSHGLCFVAEQGDEIVGSCTCASRTIEWQDTGQLSSVSVRRPWRRKGVATALAQHALRAFWQRGTHRIIAVTDQENFTGAPDFLKGVGMTAFRSTDSFEKVIRPGIELRNLKNN